MKFSVLLILASVSFSVSSAYASPQVVSFNSVRDAQPGSIVIVAKQRALYFVLGAGQAIRYPVAVPKHGKEWSGFAHVAQMVRNPDWAPPADVHHDHPELPNLIRGGSPGNPMGVAALVLDRDELAIHGTTIKMRNSIGTAASYGCTRMYNEDISDLYSRVRVGTVVQMIP